jgi:hypothetical protein
MRTAALCSSFWVATFTSCAAFGQAPEVAAPAAPAPTPALTPSPAPAPPPLPAPPPAPEAPPPTASCSCALRHDGFYTRITSGFAYTSVFGSGPNGSASVSGTGSLFSLAIGGTLAPGIVLAGVLAGTTGTSTFHGGPFANATITGAAGSTGPIAASDNAGASSFDVGLLLDWFPDPAKGLHVGGSVGLGGVALTNQADGSFISGLGLGAGLFGGYDFWVGPAWSLGLALVASGVVPPAHLADSNRNDTGYRMTPLAMGLEVSILYY